MSDISTSGSFKNLLCTGVSTSDSIGELLDNSIDAHATQINVKIKGEYILVSDNGVGMDKVELKNALRLAERKESSTKNGRFGMGLKHAYAQITQLEHTIKIISKKIGMDEDDSSELDIDFPTIIQEDRYSNTANFISARSKPLWSEHAVSQSNGTLHCIRANQQIMQEIIDMTEHSDNLQLHTHYSYNLGWIYGIQIQQHGLRIELFNNSNQSSIIAVDPLEWGKTIEQKRRRTELVVYKKECELRLLYTRQDKTGYVTKGKAKGARKKFNECSVHKMISEGFTQYSQMEHKSCYNTEEDWNMYQEYIHERFKTLPAPQSAKKSPGQRKQLAHLGGRYWRRNDKRIMRANIENPTSGDTTRYSYVTNSRHELCFDHKMDDFIKVLINKSKLNEDQICDAVKNTTDYLENEFVNLMYSEFEPTPEPKSTKVTTITPAQTIVQPPVHPVIVQEEPKQTIVQPPVHPVIVQEPKQIIPQSASAPPQTKFNIKPNRFAPPPPSQEVKTNRFTSPTPTQSNATTQPAVISVSSYTQNTLTITQGKHTLNKWLESNEKQSELERTIESMIVKYQDMSAEQQTRYWFQFTTLQNKFNMLMFLIDNKYGSGQPERDMLGGSDLFRQYSIEFPSV